MSVFGAKEVWMEPMNKFLQASRPEFRTFVDQVCSVPSERPNQAVSASYATPIQILARLPPTSREGFPSLPFLIDSAKSFATLISLWLRQRPADVEARRQKDPALRRFHELCVEIQQRSKDCLSSAEPAERPSGGLEPQWKRLLEERERADTFYETTTSRPISLAGDVVPGISHDDALPKRLSNSFVAQPLSPPIAAQDEGPGRLDTPRSPPSMGGDQSRPAWSATARMIDANPSSENSSTFSLEGTKNSRIRSNTGNRDGSSKHRFKDLMGGGSARRRTREDDDDF